MALALNPHYAARLAEGVYDVRSSITLDDFIAEYKNDMEISKSSFPAGTTGGCIVKKTHVMGVLAVGKGFYKNQAFIAFKGTASLYDVLTDLNAGVKTSHTGLPVHQGFFYAFDSVLNEVRRFLSGLKGVSAIHCVGHSLGGAIATLAADWIKTRGAAATVNLYTFGSPRVGLGMFAQKCTSRLVADNIYRVYHKTDPIAMVPTWPFSHVPSTQADYLIDSPQAVPPWKYHYMRHYIESVERSGGWDAIRTNRPKAYGQVVIENWLKSDGMVSLTASTLGLLDAALLYVLKKIAQAQGIVIGGTLSAGLTLLDRLAIILGKAVDISADLSHWVYRLVKKMAALVGITLKKGTNLTVAFIRKVFIFLHQKIADMVFRVGRSIG